MRKAKILTVLFAVWTFGAVLHAQSKKATLGFQSLSAISIDGDLSDWPTLHEVSEDTTWSFAVGKDEKYLYIAAVVANPVLQVEVARDGILININTDGKKKDGARLVFPVPDAETIRAMRNDENLRADQVRNELISRSRGYQVEGFPTIVDGLLSFENTYDVHAVAKVTEDDLLVYEAAIPIAQLRLKDKRKPIAVQVQLNHRWRTMQAMANRAASNQQYRGYGYGIPTSRPTVKTPFKGKTDVWIIDSIE